MVTPNRQRALAKLLAVLGKTDAALPPDNLSVLDHLLLAILQEGTTFTRAAEAYRALLENFHDHNELRVSHPREVEQYFPDLPMSELKAKRILSVLQFVFETTYAFDLETMRKKPIKQAQKQLSKISGTTNYTVAATVQRALGGHALPLDQPMSDVLALLDLVDAGESLDQVRASLEHQVPKSSGLQFCLALSEIAADPKRRDKLVEAIVGRPRPKASRSSSPKAPPRGKTPAADKRSPKNKAAKGKR